jgi:hypothetical protein
MRATQLCLLAGTTIGLVAPRFRADGARAVATQPAVEAPAASGAGSGSGSASGSASVSVSAPRIGCAEHPESVGAPLAALPAWPGGVRGMWQVAVSRHACVIAAWEGARLVVSWDDGVTFSPIVASTSPLSGVAAADDGTVFATRDDGTLEVVHADGSTTTRQLAFRGAPLARGRWLVINGAGARVGGDAIALSADEGATWRVLEVTSGYLLDLRVLDDGAIVGNFDHRGELCDHFGCGDGPTSEISETHLDGRPWAPATARHARAVEALADQPTPPAGVALPQLDSHRRTVAVAGATMIVRDTGRGWRVLYTGAL